MTHDQDPENAVQIRLETLLGYDVLDSAPEAEFDAIVQEAAALAATPIALISFLDEHRQWFKAKVGLDLSETPLASSFCTQAIRGYGVFEVEDASVHPDFSANPLVTGSPGIRFYAGAPLKTADGVRIGTVCVIDSKPRSKLTIKQRRHLVALAARVIALLERRKKGGLPIHLIDAPPSAPVPPEAEK